MRHTGAAERVTPPPRPVGSSLITGGAVATCASLDAEALYSAQTPDEYEQLRADRRAAYEYLTTENEHWQAAFAAQRELARTSRHRAVGIADLLTAALAAEHRLTLVHYDSDFEIAAEVLPVDHRWVAERGTIPEPATAA